MAWHGLAPQSVEEDALMAVQRELDTLLLPAVPKAQLRDRLGQLRKQPPGPFKAVLDSFLAVGLFRWLLPRLKKQQKKKGKVSKEEQEAALAELKQAGEW